MNFFSLINDMMSESVDLNITLRKKEGKITVSVLPKSNGLNDTAKNKLVPLILTGTPEELDQDFINTVAVPINEASGLLINMKVFEDGKKAVDDASKAATERKNIYSKLIKKADDLEKDKKYKEAVDCLKQARTTCTKDELDKLNKRIANLSVYLNQGSLFGSEPESEEVHDYINDVKEDINIDDENEIIEGEQTNEEEE